jgi:hypothetical protein
MAAKPVNPTPSSPRERSTKEKPRVTPSAIELATSDQEAQTPPGEHAVTPEDGRQRVPFKDELFLVDMDQGLMPLMEWSVANDSENPEMGPQLAALFYLLQDVVHPDDWDRFRRHARKTRAKTEDYLKFQNAAAEVITATPTGEPEASSDGSSPTTAP